MPRSLSPEETRGVVINHIEKLESLPTFQEPTPEMYDAFKRGLAFDKGRMHTTGRGKRQISVDLNMVMTEFEAVFKGKSVLDVGCGEGVFSSEIARLKKTKVTALDNDPELLARVKESKDLRTVEGSGYNLQEAVGDEKYDVVMVSYSSLFWAANEQQKKAAITSPLGVCAAGGTVLFVPLISDPEQGDFNRKHIEAAKAKGSTEMHLTPSVTTSIEESASTVYVQDWLDVAAVDTLLDKEAAGEIDLTFVSSRDNARNLRLHPAQEPTLKRYSAIATLIEAK
jgi:ubiquinone/menaquinone biosynthesis C-methylase UbiE